MLIGLQGSLQVEHGPSLVEGMDAPKVASDRGCLCCHFLFPGMWTETEVSKRGVYEQCL